MIRYNSMSLKVLANHELGMVLVAVVMIRFTSHFHVISLADFSAIIIK